MLCSGKWYTCKWGFSLRVLPFLVYLFILNILCCCFLNFFVGWRGNRRTSPSVSLRDLKLLFALVKRVLKLLQLGAIASLIFQTLHTHACVCPLENELTLLRKPQKKQKQNLVCVYPRPDFACFTTLCPMFFFLFFYVRGR